MTSLNVGSAAYWVAEHGPVTLQARGCSPKLCRATRAAASILERLAPTMPRPFREVPWIVTTGDGEPSLVSGDPHHVIERELAGLFDPLVPPVTLSGPDMLASALVELELALTEGSEAIWIAVDLTTGAEACSGITVTREHARAVVQRCSGRPSSSPHRLESRFAHNPSAPALAMARVLQDVIDGSGRPASVELRSGSSSIRAEGAWVEIRPINME